MRPVSVQVASFASRTVVLRWRHAVPSEHVMLVAMMPLFQESFFVIAFHCSTVPANVSVVRLEQPATHSLLITVTVAGILIILVNLGH